MKRILLMAIIACLFTTHSHAQNTGYSITGRIQGLPDGVKFFLIRSTDLGTADTLANVKSKNQQFSFTGEIPLVAELVFVKMDTSEVKLNSKRDSWVRLLLDNSKIIIIGELQRWPEVAIKGSVPTEDYENYINVITDTLNKLNKVIESAKDDSSLIAQAKRQYSIFLLKRFEEKPNSYATPLLMIYSYLKTEDAEPAYSKLTTLIKGSFYGKKLLTNINAEKASRTIAIGNEIPDFSIQTVLGKSESVKNMIRQSQFTLIDFWASWCAPCRADIPNMKKVYNEFHKKGFNIISVSTDTNKEAWRKALKEDQTPWINGIQLSQVSKSIFNIMAIPAYILVDNKGVIIDIDYTKYEGKRFIISEEGGLSGEDLHKAIANLIRE